MILDTTFLLDLLKREPGALKRAADLERASETLHTTSVNLFELGQGFISRGPEHRRQVEGLVSGLHVLPLDADAARLGGEIWGDLRRRGREIDTHDAMIAGIALRHGQVVLTRNVEHFGRVRGLRVEAY